MSVEPDPSVWERARRLVFGRPRSLEDPHVFHRISLVAFLAWVGLGADGLSSSSYGPEETFKTLLSPALGDHTYLAVGLAFAVAITVFVISYAYSRIVEQFPFGGGGYVVATRLLGPRFGVVSGSALLVDYVLTVTVSIAAGADAFYSFLPPEMHQGKVVVELMVILALTAMNLRGVKESVTVLMPIFLGFLATHAIVIGGTFLLRGGEAPAIAREVHHDFVSKGLGVLGFIAMTRLFLRAYCMGAGTYTGIEAVSNGLQIMREPKVETAKKTMLLMALSLAATAGGITLCYLLVGARPDPEGHQTMNAVLTLRFVDLLGLGGSAAGLWFFRLTMFAEAALLFVAAQAGFIDGPRVMANMASDSWLPHRFAQLSERLTMQYGILLISGAACLILLATGGNTTALVLMYSINVFLTFSLSESAMVRHWIRQRRRHADWKKKISIHLVGLVMCVTILAVNVAVKFTEGGWITLVVTAALIALCFVIRRHYRAVNKNLKRLDAALSGIPTLHPDSEPRPLDRHAPTAALLVGGYGGLGIHTMLSVQRLFPGHFKNWIFLSVGVIDSATFKGVDEVEEVRERTRDALERYVGFARAAGLNAAYRMDLGTEAVDAAEKLCREVAGEFPNVVFFAGKLIFQRERWYQRLLHNETGYALQRRLQFEGLNAMVLPVRVLEG